MSHMFLLQNQILVLLLLDNETLLGTYCVLPLNLRVEFYIYLSMCTCICKHFKNEFFFVSSICYIPIPFGLHVETYIQFSKNVLSLYYTLALLDPREINMSNTWKLLSRGQKYSLFNSENSNVCVKDRLE